MVYKSNEIDKDNNNTNSQEIFSYGNSAIQ